MRPITRTLGYGIMSLAVIGGVAFVYQANRPAPTPAVQGDATSPMSAAIKEVAAGQAQLIDVRTPTEFANGHAKDAINLDSVDIQAGKLPNLAKDAKIYLYCHSGRRAGIVLGILQQNGFTNVTNLGAFQAWLDAGGPSA